MPRRRKQPEEAAPSRQQELREKLAAAFGRFSTTDRVASFLYELMRDHVTPGVVQQILGNIPPGKQKLSNPLLARYAVWVSKELRK